MTSFAGRPWDMFRSELVDTMHGQHKSRPALPCKYCGVPTRSIYQVCCDHTDLLDLDPQAPAALEETRAAQDPNAELAAELASPTALVSSSAAAKTHVPPGTNGDVPGVAAALDSSEPV